VSGLDLFWRFVDWLDYWFWDVRLRVVDAVYGPEPETSSLTNNFGANRAEVGDQAF